MQEARFMALTRGKLVALKVAKGSSRAEASAWADKHLEDAVASARKAPKGTDPFAGLAAWVESHR